MESMPRDDEILMGATTTDDDQQSMEGDTTTDDEQPMEDDEGQPRRSLNRSANEILEFVSDTHKPDPEVDTSLDIDSLFKTTETIIKDSADFIRNYEEGLLGREQKLFWASLKSLGCECPDDETGFESSMLEILQKVSKYSWGAKALLVLKDFSLEHESHDQLGKLVEISKGLLICPSDQHVNLKRRQKAVIQLNQMIESTFWVIKNIFDLQEFSSDNYYDPNNVPELAKAIDEAIPKIPVSVYWCLITTVACVKQVARLANEEEKPHDLSQFENKIWNISRELSRLLSYCRRERDIIMGIYQPWEIVLESYNREMTDSMEVLRNRIFREENVRPILIDGDTKNQVSVDVLSFKNIFVFFSGLDIPDDDISLLKQVHEETKKDDKHKIVWIPIVEQWTDDLERMFETLRMDMEWYTVRCFSPLTAGIKYIKEEWRFKDKPILVVMNSVGAVQTNDVLPLIRKTGMQHWPFDHESLQKLRESSKGIFRFFLKA